MKGDVSARTRILTQASDDFIVKVLDVIASARRKEYSEEEWHDLERYLKEIQMLRNQSVGFTKKVKILTEVGPWFIHRLLKPLVKPKQKRIRKDCPFPNCYKLGLLQLHNHLRQVHRLTDKKDRQRWLDAARMGHYTTGNTEKRIVYKFVG